MAGSTKLPPVPQMGPSGFQDPVWARWFNSLQTSIQTTITGVTVAGSEITGSTTFDNGQLNLTLALQPTGITAGTYGSGSTIPVITFDSKGRALSASNVQVTLTLVRLSIASTSLTSQAVGTTGTNIGNLALAAGVWEIGGAVTVRNTAGVMSAVIVGASTTSPTFAGDGTTSQIQNSNAVMTNIGLPVPQQAITIPTGGGTVGILALATFASGTTTVAGQVYAKRIG